MKRSFTAATVVLLLIFSALTGASASKPAEQQSAAQREEVVRGEYFVAFRDAVTPGDIASVKSLGARVHREFPEVRAVAIKINNPQAVAALERNPRVEYVEPVPMRYPAGLATQQLVPSLLNGLYGLITTKATDVHSRGVSGTGIKVGIADTGIDYNHPDIAANYKGGIDTVHDDNDPAYNDADDPTIDPADAETHATHVAGTILGVNNTVGVYGVAYGAQLYHARVLTNAGGSTSNIMDGVRWLVETAGCKVVNMSLGGSLKSRTEENFYKSMRSKGALIVCATGNDGANRISFPAGYAVNIAVGAVDRNNAHASFSNAGTNIDVSAPGVMVLSSVPNNHGSEASVTTGSTFTAFGMEFAGQTSGVTATIVNCGLGQVGEFPASVVGNIALIGRGTNSFADKVTNAISAGAVAAIIYNNVAGDFSGTLGAAGNWIPAVAVSDAAGAALVSQAGSTGTVVNQVSSWDHYDGTSMATPHVTGVVALIWSANPALSNTTVESYLFTTCKDLGAAGYDTVYGNGLVNASAAVAKAGK